MGIPVLRAPGIESAIPVGRSARQPNLLAPADGRGAVAPDPADLVSRALAILNEESAAWQARQVAALPRWTPR